MFKVGDKVKLKPYVKLPIIGYNNWQWATKDTIYTVICADMSPQEGQILKFQEHTYVHIAYHFELVYRTLMQQLADFLEQDDEISV